MEGEIIVARPVGCLYNLSIKKNRQIITISLEVL
jgi:hypothetical protein